MTCFLGLYYYSLINAPSQTRYSYRPLLTWDSLYRSLLLESALDDELRDYERKLQEINDMETFQLEMDIDNLIRKLKRAKED
jgi:hypothetical protein